MLVRHLEEAIFQGSERVLVIGTQAEAPSQLFDTCGYEGLQVGFTWEREAPDREANRELGEQLAFRGDGGLS